MIPKIKITSSLDGSVNFLIESKDSLKKYSLNVYDKNNDLIYSSTNCLSSSEIKIDFKIENPHLWYLSDPYLYHYSLMLDNKIVNGTFGIRKISTSSKYITLNDIPIFVRGYIRGIEAHDHKNNCNLSEEEFYRKNIRTAKKFGFNLVRFHSTIPSETFFKVADEEGILVHIEMRPPHDIYNNLEEMVKTKSDFIDPCFIKETVDKLYNHPSFAVYCLGNEIKNLQDSDEIIRIGNMIKTLDPTRLYIDTCAWGENNRPLVDIDVQHMSYFFPFGKHADMYDDTNNLLVGDFNKGKEIKFSVPLLAHEVCHYTALRDFKSLKEKFIANGIAAPWWVDEELKMIHEKGYDDLYPTMYQASKYFQRTCWKIAYEAMRSSKLLGGFHFLQFADTDKYENANGVVDCFDDINGIEPKDFNIFNGDILLLTKLKKYNYFDTEDLNLNIFISRFDELPLNKASLKISLGQQEILVKDVDISKHDYYKISNVTFKFNRVDKKTRLELKLRLFDGEKLLSENSYNVWVYPKQVQFSYKEYIKYDKDGIIVTDSIATALEKLEENKNVILCYRSDLTRHVAHKDMALPQYALRASWNRFKPVIWDRGTNFGGIIDSNLLKKYGFDDPYLDLDLSILSEDSDKIILDNIPFKVINLMSGIDKCNRDRFDAYKNSFNLPELMYDRTLRNFSFLFTLNVDNKKLVVVGLNLLGLDNNEPSSEYMANCLLDIVKHDECFNNEKTSLVSLKQYFEDCAKEPVKERIMTQFWCLDDAPVESKQFWIDSREYLIK